MQTLIVEKAQLHRKYSRYLFRNADIFEFGKFTYHNVIFVKANMYWMIFIMPAGLNTTGSKHPIDHNTSYNTIYYFWSIFSNNERDNFLKRENFLIWVKFIRMKKLSITFS